MYGSISQQNKPSPQIKSLADNLVRCFDPASEMCELEKIFPASRVIRDCGDKVTVLVVCNLSGYPENRELNGDHKFIAINVTRDGVAHTYFLAFPIELVSEHRLMKSALDMLLQNQPGGKAQSKFVDGGYITLNKKNEQLVIWPIAQSGCFGKGDATQRRNSEEVFASLKL